MVTGTLVDVQIDDGQELLDRLQAENLEIRAACWVKPYEGDRCSLYIVAPMIDEKGPMETYNRFLSIFRSLGTLSIDSSDVSLVGEKNQVAQDVLALLKRFPGVSRPPSTLVGGMLGLEVLYVYTQGNTRVTIYHLVFPETGAGILAFDPLLLNGRVSMEVESQGERKVFHGKTSIDCVVAVPGGAKLERTSDGLMVLNWQLHNVPRQSNANEVWSLANLGLHGFRFLRTPA